jgi:electron transfer flavoprotein beta subunit
MNTIVLMKFVPDPVEELEIDSTTHLLDRSFLRLIPNELDEHALEQAILLKERHGGTVTVVTIDTGEVDEALYTAAAKGADRLLKITGENFDQGLSSRQQATLFEQVLRDLPADLILTGTQAIDDLDGFVGALVAERLGLPYVGYVTGISVEDGRFVARKEYPGGLTADIEISAPALLGVQAAEKPPRYVVTSKLMEAMKTARIEEIASKETQPDAELPVEAMALPEATTRAQMLTGSAAEVAEKLVQLLKQRGLLG